MLPTEGTQDRYSLPGSADSPPPYLALEPRGPRVSSVVLHGDPAHLVYVRGVFFCTHLHNPCLSRRGHDLFNNDNIVGLWLPGIHGKVVTHISEGVGGVVPLYNKGTTLLWATFYFVPRCEVLERHQTQGLCSPFAHSFCPPRAVGIVPNDAERKI